MIKPPLPESESDITAAWLQQALTAGSASDLPIVREVVVENIGAGVGLLGEILRCHLTYHDNPAAMPETLIVKLPSAHPQNLRMCKTLSLHAREYTYYHQVAPHVALRSPNLLYGDIDKNGHRFVLVLEDLRGMQSVDQIRGVSAPQARHAIRSIARLHGLFWDKRDHPLLSRCHDSNSLKYKLLVQTIYLINLVPTLNHFGDEFSDELRILAEAYGPRIADHISNIAAGPRTFAHGDFRVDNTFFGAEGDDDFALIDWQLSGFGSGLYDVAFFLSDSVSTEIRRQIERDALQEYHDIVCSMGATTFTFGECWRLYRQSMLACIVSPIVVCGGLDLSNDRGRQLALVMLRRRLAAIEDLDAGEFLPLPRRSLSLANMFSTLSRGAYQTYKAVR